jgi:hypothetical protein
VVSGCNNYEDTLAWLNLSTLYSSLRNPDDLLLINVLKRKLIPLQFRILQVYVYLPGKLDHIKVIPPAKWVSIFNAICKNFDFLTKILFHLLIFYYLLYIQHFFPKSFLSIFYSNLSLSTLYRLYVEDFDVLFYLSDFVYYLYISFHSVACFS